MVRVMLISEETTLLTINSEKEKGRERGREGGRSKVLYLLSQKKNKQH